MTVIPHDTSNVDIEMGFEAEATEEEATNPIQELAESILLLGFLGGLRRIKDECNALKAEYDVLVGNIDQEELVTVMESIDESYVRSQEDIDSAVELIKEFMEALNGSN